MKRKREVNRKTERKTQKHIQKPRAFSESSPIRLLIVSASGRRVSPGYLLPRKVSTSSPDRLQFVSGILAGKRERKWRNSTSPSTSSSGGGNKTPCGGEEQEEGGVERVKGVGGCREGRKRERGRELRVYVSDPVSTFSSSITTLTLS